ncbi:hypothetical protein OROMI_022517 [Orobanche minor]
MPPMSLEEQISCVRQKLECQSFDELLVRDQVRWLGLIVKKDKKCPSELLSQWTTLNELLLHASRCQDKSLLEGETLDEPLDASEQLCHYPNCERGKVLYRHVYLCPKSVCLLCQSMLHLVKFHAGACSDSNCRVPRCGSSIHIILDFPPPLEHTANNLSEFVLMLDWCSEAKEYMQRKEQRLRRNELRLRRLRRNEQRLRQLYMPESRPAAAAAAAKVTDVSNASADYHVLQLGER